MKKFFKILKRIMLIFITLIALFAIGIFIFIKTAPQFGRPPQGTHLAEIAKSANYADAKFQNLQPTEQASFGKALRVLPEFFFGKNRDPRHALPVKYGQNLAPAVDTMCYVTWYGHSAFLIEMAGKRILIDPMLGKTAAPVSFGAHRFKNESAIPIEELTDIDAVIFSHDHYDHLDYQTVLKLKYSVKHFYTPLGLGAHLQRWGVAAADITELDWWQNANLGNITLTAAPARHFSGRSIGDGNCTQWASWILTSDYKNLYFSGDGGYGAHFKEIGEKFGPFDLAMLECGQYNDAWKDIHMKPEESVQAGFDVKASLIMPIHWGAFTLAVHTWTEPVIRFTDAAAAQKMPVVHPYIGERFAVGIDYPSVKWWVEE